MADEGLFPITIFAAIAWNLHLQNIFRQPVLITLDLTYRPFIISIITNNIIGYTDSSISKIRIRAALKGFNYKFLNSQAPDRTYASLGVFFLQRDILKQIK